MLRALIVGGLIACEGVQAPRADERGFVSTDGIRFTQHGQPYFYAGVNYWYGINLASAGPGGDRDRLERELDLLVQMDIRNLRIMAGSEGPNEEPWRMVPALQPQPGVYDPDLVDALDYLIWALKVRGLHAIMCLSNFWHWSGGFAQYVSWNGGGPIPYPPPQPGGDWNVFQDYASDFYSNAGAKEGYRSHAAFLIQRFNPYTGLSYRDEPAIMAWELANEPRGYNNNAVAFNQWIDEIAAFIKSLDNNHLLTTGCEGDTPWPVWNGLDFIANHDGPDIDYTTCHIWPQNWGWYDPSDAEGSYPHSEQSALGYLQDHVAMALALDKPLVLEEFGLARDGGSYDPMSSTFWRDGFLEAMYVAVYASAAGGGPICGDNVWAWAGEGRPMQPYGSWWMVGDSWIGDPPHEPQGWYSIYDTDSSTDAVLIAHATEMYNLVPQTAVPELGQRGESGSGSLHVFPSPSRGSAYISVTLPESCEEAKVEVFDVLGRRQSCRHAPDGTLQILWSSTEVSSSVPRAGIYFVRLSWDAGHRIQKLVILN